MKNLAAAILAGGYGRRIKEHSSVLHKSLLSLSNGSTIIGRMMNQLYKNGVERIFIVHFIPIVEELINEVNSQTEYMDIQLNFVRQDPFKEYGTMYALKNIFEQYRDKDDLIIVEGDVVCSDNVINAICNASGTVLVIDDNISTDSEAMKAKCSNGKITYLSKAISGYPEFCGVMRFTAKHRNLFLDNTSFIKVQDPFYEDAFNIILDNKKGFPFLQISRNDWIEIDTADDFDEAKKKIMKW